MNYGKSAYTKVLELEKRVGEKTTGESIKIYDNESNKIYQFNSELIIPLDNLLVHENDRIYFKISFDIDSDNQSEISAEFFIDNIKVANKKIYTDGLGKKSSYLEFTYVSSMSKINNAFLKLISNNNQSNYTIENYKIIVINAEGDQNRNAFGVEIRACKTPNNTFIISYNDEGIVYACEIDENSKDLNFLPIIHANYHCFAFDKQDNLHLYYVDYNNKLYDKIIDSIYNDVLISENVYNVYAIKSSEKISSDIVVAFIDLSLKNVFYLSLENGVLGEIKKMNLPDLRFIDLSMATSDDFVYMVVTCENGTSLLVKSAYEPTGSFLSENITSSLAVVLEKYYTLSDYSDELMDVVSASLSLSHELVLNYEKVIENFAKDTVITKISKTTETYEISQESPTLYTVVIDKTDRKYTDRCVYADDAVGLEPMVKILDKGFFSYGWENRFPVNKIKPCALQGGKFLGYLNPNDFSLFEDGTPVNSDDPNNFIDVMIEIPKIYYCIENIDPYIYVHIANYKVDDKYKCYAHVYDGKELDKIYIGAYHCGYKNYKGKNTMFSFTNTYPNCYDVTTTTRYSELLENKEVGYRMLNLDQTILLQCIFIVLFKSTGSQWTFSSGNNSQSGIIFPNGFCDKSGMFYANYTADDEPCKMLGIENIFGNCYTRVEGFSIEAAPEYSEYKFKRRNPYSNLPTNGDDSLYDVYLNPSLNGINVDSFFLNDPYGTTELGFLANSQKYNNQVSTYSRFYCDRSFIATTKGAWWGGDGKAYTGGGIFHYKNDKGVDLTENFYGYRLVYYPI